MVILLAVPSKLAQLFPSIPTLIPKRTQEWQNGLCSCSPGHSCVLSLLFPDLRMLNSRSTAPISRRNITRRTEIRDKFGIKVQQDNEVKTRLGYESLSEGYQVNTPMEIPQKDLSPRIEASSENNEPSNASVAGEK
ncbi:hypothetical protein NW759_001609 [Fusarium solani]|nr:hypothetical protein NW759_001609 [Fusarium solani]